MGRITSILALLTAGVIVYLLPLPAQTAQTDASAGQA